ncbi:MAG: hypothetical protein HYZ53_24695 [Planctomycetes bacterium]|nr:hypothetical protein [Planctomycetota bacterium]
MVASALDVAASLTPRQAKAAALIGSGRGPTATAEELGLSRRTLGRWRALPAFETAVAAARREVWRDSLDALRGGLPAAVAVLVAELAGEDKLKAAVALVRAAGLGSPAVPLDPAAADIPARIAALEAAALAAKPGGNGNGRLLG